MRTCTAPALAPATGVLVGSALAPRLEFLPIPLLGLLVCLALSLRRGWGFWLAAVGVGVLNAAVFWVLPARQAPPLRPDLPVEATLEVVGPWQRSAFGWGARAELQRLRQGAVVTRQPRDLRLFLGPEGEPPRARRLVVRGYLRRSPGYGNGVPRRPGPWRMTIKSPLLVRELDRGLGLGWLAHRLRERVGLWGLEGEHGRALAVVRALLLGDRGGLPQSWQSGLRRFGLAHLLAVSGLHVAMLLAPVLLLSRGWPPWIRGLAGATAVATYVVLVGPRPSLLRAAAMAALMIVAHLVSRPPQLLNSLSLVVLVVLLVEPAVVEDLGFRLTVSATAGVLLLGPFWSARWSKRPRPVVRALAASAGAQLGSLPFALPELVLFCPVAPLVNLVAIPWAGLLLIVSLVVVGVGQVSRGAAEMGLSALDLLIRPLAWLSAVPPGLTTWATLPLSLDRLGATLLGLGLAALLTWPRRLLLPAVGLCPLALAVGCPSPQDAEVPEVVMLDVGQGDATLLRHRGRTVLIDGGGRRGNGDFAATVLLPALAELGARSLDVLVMSHPDVDHCGGLVDVSRYLPVGEVWLSEGWRQEGCAEQLVVAHPGRLRYLRSGDRLSVAGWRFEVLHPDRDSGGTNARSLVLRARNGPSSLLFTGDIDAGTEAELVARFGRRLESLVLKVPHHGSRSSSSPPFLDAVSPRLALLSVGGGNRYGHPAAEVLERYRRRRVWVLRTDVHGAVRLTRRPHGPFHVGGIR